MSLTTCLEGAIRQGAFRLDTGEAGIRWCGPPVRVTADLVPAAPRPVASRAFPPQDPSLALRLGRPRPQPLVLDAVWDKRRIRAANCTPNGRRDHAAQRPAERCSRGDSHRLDFPANR